MRALQAPAWLVSVCLLVCAHGVGFNRLGGSRSLCFMNPCPVRGLQKSFLSMSSKCCGLTTGATAPRLLGSFRLVRGKASAVSPSPFWSRGGRRRQGIDTRRDVLVARGFGCTEYYSWKETDSEMDIRVKLPQETNVDNIVCDIGKDWIYVRLKTAEEPIIRGQSKGLIRVHDSFWSVSREPEFLMLNMRLQKRDSRVEWGGVIEGDQPMSIAYDELSGETPDVKRPGDARIEPRQVLWHETFKRLSGTDVLNWLCTWSQRTSFRAEDVGIPKLRIGVFPKETDEGLSLRFDSPGKESIELWVAQWRENEEHWPPGAELVVMRGDNVTGLHGKFGRDMAAILQDGESRILRKLQQDVKGLTPRDSWELYKIEEQGQGNQTRVRNRVFDKAGRELPRRPGQLMPAPKTETEKKALKAAYASSAGVQEMDYEWQTGEDTRERAESLVPEEETDWENFFVSETEKAIGPEGLGENYTDVEIARGKLSDFRSEYEKDREKLQTIKNIRALNEAQELKDLQAANRTRARTVEELRAEKNLAILKEREEFGEDGANLPVTDWDPEDITRLPPFLHNLTVEERKKFKTEAMRSLTERFEGVLDDRPRLPSFEQFNEGSRVHANLSNAEMSDVWAQARSQCSEKNLNQTLDPLLLKQRQRYDDWKSSIAGPSENPSAGEQIMAGPYKAHSSGWYQINAATVTHAENSMPPGQPKSVEDLVAMRLRGMSGEAREQKREEILRDAVLVDRMVDDLYECTDKMMFDQLCEDYKPIMLEEHYVLLLQHKLAHEPPKTDREKALLKRLNEFAVKQLETLELMWAQNEQDQMRKIQIFCEQAVEDDTQMTRLAEKMRPMLDSAFFQYLQYAMELEKTNIRGRGINPELQPSYWLMILTIIHKGCSNLYEREVHQTVQWIGRILTQDPQLVRRRMLEYTIALMPKGDWMQFRKLCMNIAAWYDHVPAEENPHSYLHERVRQLRYDINELLPEWFIMGMMTESDKEVMEDNIKQVPVLWGPELREGQRLQKIQKLGSYMELPQVFKKGENNAEDDAKYRMWMMEDQKKELEFVRKKMEQYKRNPSPENLFAVDDSSSPAVLKMGDMPEEERNAAIAHQQKFIEKGGDLNRFGQEDPMKEYYKEYSKWEKEGA
uniref:NudC domain-containing protein 1 n=1 Tax=Chromera velia CCMP2878 TaxID=1169474 RepID=A0A0G4I482_9ALVE|eukprot:Cvel_10859.t1-p1 / transcript=Cvel_10859.t1 / gene=Cvel_10859 / organism=Chromera_velia_CCMP2878 / gene_product=hypothetical protein / transcript_product=hypothetical protein / location=Cvel_scaffold665:25565-40979(-) / protein_length=1135 / sequence_SO=supercontig / SO=protein_coding / is_pseudo=false